MDLFSSFVDIMNYNHIPGTLFGLYTEMSNSRTFVLSLTQLYLNTEKPHYKLYIVCKYETLWSLNEKIFSLSYVLSFIVNIDLFKIKSYFVTFLYFNKMINI